MTEETLWMKEYRNYYANKSLGQHFLVDKQVADNMAANAEITSDDTVLEIGPGPGILSESLARSKAGTVILCEKDERFVDILKQKITSKRVKIIREDALVLIPNLQVSPPLKVVSNLPYNISSPVITSLLTACPTLPEMIIVMLQKEVAERLSTEAGNRNRGILTVLVELYGKSQIIDYVSKTQFFPAPKVDSAVLMISDLKKPDLNTKLFMRMLKFSFAGKRKKIKNSLFTTLKVDLKLASEIANTANISLDDRPEDLNINQWKSLFSEIENYLS